MSRRDFLLVLFVLLFYTQPSYSSLPDAIDLPQDDYQASMFWGSYRPGIYFGMKTRSESPILTGMMYSSAFDQRTLKHKCHHEDNFDKYGWTMHNGRDFGRHEIIDSASNVKLYTSFIKQASSEEFGGNWANRIEGVPFSSKTSEDSLLSIFFYVALPESCQLEAIKTTKKSIYHMNSTKHPKGSSDITLSGRCPDVENFTFLLSETLSKAPLSYSGTQKKLLSNFHVLGIKKEDEESWDIFEQVKNALDTSYSAEIFKASKKSKDPVGPRSIIPLLPNKVAKGSNVFVFQRVVSSPFHLDAVFLQHQGLSGGASLSSGKLNNYRNSLSGDKLSTLLEEKEEEFVFQFERKFHLKEAQGLDERIVPCAQSAFSNMIGGIGYWHGESLIYEGSDNSPSVMAAASLFSAVPSRPFFPRGFLWDEGFHQLLLVDWEKKITFDVIRHWLNLMHESGWIPREQILGSEARSRVPSRFQPQHKDHANPPTFFLTVDKLIRKFQKKLAKVQQATQLFSDGTSLSQAEQVDMIIQNEAELADMFSFFQEIYPRLLHWNRWLIESQSGSLENTFRWRGRDTDHTLSSGLDDYPRAPSPSTEELHLDLQCWISFSTKTLETLAHIINKEEDSTMLRTETEKLVDNLSLYWDPTQQMYADIFNVTSSPIQYSPHVGYISLFPMMLGLLPIDSPYIPSILSYVSDIEHLWSPYGLRSLSKSDRFYAKGENYWRGPIWVNMNYLFLSSLKLNYFGGPYELEVRKVYTSLREAMVKNMVLQFQTSGYIWEQYDQNSGKGRRTRPFTGWSGLVLNLMSENY